MSSTAAASQALTTPFVPPTSCVDQFVTTSFVTSFYWNSYSTTTVHVLASGPSDSRFAACQPAGWDQEPRFQFSPAVCPSGWTAYHLGGTVGVARPAATLKTYSAAFCCSSGFTLSYFTGFPIQGITDTVCLNGNLGPTTSTSVSTAQASTESQQFSSTLLMHNPWRISWAAADVSTLSPPPPQLQCTTSVLSTWVPGATVDPSLLASACSATNDGTSRWSAGETSAVWFLMIGLPIILLLIISSCIACYCRSRRRKKRAKAQQLAGDTHDAIGLVKVGGR